MILRDRDRTVDPCCDNVVGLVFGDLWPAIIFILCFVYFDHNGGSASTRCPRWPRSSTRTTSLHGFTKCDCINKFFLTEGNKKILIHKEKSRFPFSATAHRDFEIFKKAVLDFCGVQSSFFSPFFFDMQNEELGFLFCIAQNAKWTDSENNKQGFALDVIFQNKTVCNFLTFFSVKREMPILFFVNCERTVLFSVKRDLDPPFTTLQQVLHKIISLCFGQIFFNPARAFAAHHEKSFVPPFFKVSINHLYIFDNV